MKTRLDAELVRRELARSREQAADLIEKRAVLVAGIPATKPATQVDAETSIVIAGERDDFVSRGGHKLEHAVWMQVRLQVDLLMFYYVEMLDMLSLSMSDMGNWRGVFVKMSE